MIYDCFPFFNELDILEIRFSILYQHVDRFVLVEAKQTHSYNDKPLYFEENKQRFSKYSDKIEHLIIEKFPKSEDPWVSERFQRDTIIEGLKHCNDNDIIIVSDVDEIPSPELLKGKIDRLLKIEMPFHYYYINYQTNQMWRKSFISPYSDIKGKSLTLLRMNLAPVIPFNYEFSFHLSFLFGNDYQEYIHKIKSFAHQEYNKPIFCNVEHIKCCIKYGFDIFLRPKFKLKHVRIKFFYAIPNYNEFNKYYYKRNMFSLIPSWSNIRALIKMYLYKNFPEVKYDNPLFNSFKYVMKRKMGNILKS